ncbi:WD repeat-containing protein 82 [Basidiobolus ranarum]|uniref:WD repeat-containing protein 82 n=2 Tax=Basidiobolus ranarum TaxID=34480 RepID=A0ABR2WZX5_9FUNG
MTANLTIPITSAGLSTLRISKSFQENESPVTSIDFDDYGEFCITAAADESLHLYDCRQGKSLQTLYSKKYGVHLARFTHNSNTVVYASTKEDDTLRFLSLHDNKYIRYFRGHKKKVYSLDMSPADEFFLSGSIDGSVRLWDSRSPNCQGLIHTMGRPSVSFDPQGAIFAIASEGSVRLYDIKSFDKGPFSTFPVYQQIQEKFPEYVGTCTSVKFNNDTNTILITNSVNGHFVLNAHTGEIQHCLTGTNPLQVESSGEETTFTPDGKYVYAGSKDGSVRVWNLENSDLLLEPSQIIPTHPAPITAIGFNPRYMMMVSASEGNDVVSISLIYEVAY